jgi:multidrug efflux pump
MNPSRPFILRPVATALLMVALFLAGGVALLPAAGVGAAGGGLSHHPGADLLSRREPGRGGVGGDRAAGAAVRRGRGTEPDDVDQRRRRLGDRDAVPAQPDIDVAEQEVQAAINAAQSYLPANLPTPPVYSKSNPADAPVLTLALTSNEMPLSQVEDLADTRLAPKISQITGVGLVSISGGQKPAVRIQANPTALAAYGINLEDLRNALTGNSLNSAKGNFDGPAQDYTINANDQLLTSGDYKSVVVAYRNGAPVMLTDVARVVDGVENNKLAAWRTTRRR